MAQQEPIGRGTEGSNREIPDKLYFRIGDVAKLCDVPAYVLRFWETEFPSLKPNKGGTGQRLYRKRDVEMALRIKNLLYDQGYTIQGARQVFKAEAQLREQPVALMAAESAAPTPIAQAQPVQPHAAELRRDVAMQALRGEMHALVGILSKPAGSADASKVEAGKVKAMRPRLVLEPRLAPVAVTQARRQPTEQRDLFGGPQQEEPEAAE